MDDEEVKQDDAADDYGDEDGDIAVDGGGGTQGSEI